MGALVMRKILVLILLPVCSNLCFKGWQFGEGEDPVCPSGTFLSKNQAGCIKCFSFSDEYV